MKVTLIPIIIGALETIPKELVKGKGRLGNKKTSRDLPDYCIIMIGQNNEKSSGVLRRLAVTQTPVKNYLLILD